MSIGLRSSAMFPDVTVSVISILTKRSAASLTLMSSFAAFARVRMLLLWRWPGALGLKSLYIGPFYQDLTPNLQCCETPLGD